MSTEQAVLFDVVPDYWHRLRETKEKLMQASRSANTMKAYAHAWKKFCAWCSDVGVCPLPATEQTISNFIVWALYERERRYRISNICVTLSAITLRHRENQLESPVTERVRHLLHNAKRDLQERPAGKQALEPSLLRRICSQLDEGSPIQVRDHAMFLMQFAAGWRCSEVTSLDLSDVRFTRKGYILYLGASKTDQDGSEGRIVGIEYGDRERTCPVRALKAWISLRGRWPGPLFTAVHGSGAVLRRGLRGININTRMKGTLKTLGVDNSQFGSHSFRAGCVTTAVRRGASESLIMLRTGHKSIAMMHKYVRTAKAFHANPLRGVL